MVDIDSTDVQATLCVYDYLLHPAVRGDLNRALAAAKGHPDGAQIIQAFLDKRGYATTPAKLKTALDTYKQQPVKVSPQATRFAVKFAALPPVRLDWRDATLKAIKAVKTTAASAAQAGGADVAAPFAEVLSRHGFTDVSPLEAATALAAMSTGTLADWAGTYSNTAIATSDGENASGPVLTIDASAEPVKVKLDSRIIFDWTYDASQSQLCWTTTGSGSLQNLTSATLNFTTTDSVINFSGTLDLPASNTYPLSGQLDYQGSAPTPVTGGGSGGDGFGDTDIMGIVFGVIGFIGVLAGVFGAYYTWKAYRARSPEAEPPRQLEERVNEADARVNAPEEQGGASAKAVGSSLDGEILKARLSSLSIEMVEMEQEIGSLPNSARNAVESEIEERASQESETTNSDADDEFDSASEDFSEVSL